ncbi:MAG TPA: HAD-IA family hydrolase [Anaerovoracaceae bacterium]|nr:HAD-IA family hydrolase [Anaerovoracaceae bacterium]
MSLVMFDYDGVIADSLDAHVKSFLAAFRDNDCTKVNTAQDVLDLYEGNVYRSMADLDLSEEEIDRILESYNVNQALLLDQIQLFPQIRELFSDLVSTGHQVYIITSNTAEAVSGVLSKRGISGVEKVMGSETAKSKIVKIHMAMDWHPDQKAYYVGDTKGDIYEGRQAGVATVGVAWGWHGPNKLLESQPDHIIYTPRELMQLIG